MFLTAIIDPSTFPGFEPVTSGFRLHWLDTRTLHGELTKQVDGLRVAGPTVASGISLQDSIAEAGSADYADAAAAAHPDDSGAAPGSGINTASDDSSDFVIIADDGGFRSTVMTPSTFSLADNNLSSPHVPSKVTRGCLTMVLPPEDRSKISDILYFVHPNGSIVFWSVSYLDTVRLARTPSLPSWLSRRAHSHLSRVIALRALASGQ
jgi:hypothetical protein